MDDEGKMMVSGWLGKVVSRLFRKKKFLKRAMHMGLNSEV